MNTDQMHGIIRFSNMICGNNPQWTSQKSGDLVLLRKFYAKWEGPLRFGDISFHSNTGRLNDIQTRDWTIIQGRLKER
jgi:hypothetical protein